jgi:endonuclease YncB( thermonuclease family)
MRSLFILLCLVLFSKNLYAADIELREYRDRLCYDGDTCYITMPALPQSLQKMSIRILGIDTPEIRGDCPKEKYLALEGRKIANELFRNGNNIEFKNLQWDKYGGRILADVEIDGQNYADILIHKGLARPYFGDKKESWCD